MKKIVLNKEFEILSVMQQLNVRGGDIDEDFPIGPENDGSDGGE